MKVIADKPRRTTRKYREIKPLVLIRQRICRQSLSDRREMLFPQAEKMAKIPAGNKFSVQNDIRMN